MPMRQYGYVLLITLVFLQIFALLGMYALTKSVNALRQDQHQWQRLQSDRQANLILVKLEKSLIQDAIKCHIPLTTDIFKKTIAWWEQYGCSANFAGIRYYYVEEDLGIDECAIISNDNNQQVIANYYRITLCMNMNNLPESKIIVQSTLAKPVMSNHRCFGHKRQLKAGRQVLRT